MSDNDIGGSSTSSLTFVPASSSAPSHIRFSGTISNQVPSDDPAIERTGYAAFRTQDRPPTLFGKQLWDVERYSYLALKIKSDGRKYKVNIQTESLEYTDLHQHRLYVRNTGAWETVLIKWTDFVRTNHGIVVEPQSEIMKTKVRTIGIGLTDRLAGPFEICVGKVWATNKPQLEEEETEVVDRAPKYVPKEVTPVRARL
jgi:NADH dehydrogenase [ubiquinone] 1 alpha subcomplex assembly factor 1